MHERTKREQKGRLECGRDVCIENHENRFADIEKREEHEWDAGRERKRVPSGGGSAMMRASGRPRLPDHPEELMTSKETTAAPEEDGNAGEGGNFSGFRV